jgi:hypothetical protein
MKSAIRALGRAAESIQYTIDYVERFGGEGNKELIENLKTELQEIRKAEGILSGEDR